MREKLVCLFDIDCRYVGPGGTTVTFYAGKGGVTAVWENENCPYEDVDGNETWDEYEAAYDGHNVSFLSWKELAKELTESLTIAVKELTKELTESLTIAVTNKPSKKRNARRQQN